jgi:hypothetical protein
MFLSRPLISIVKIVQDSGRLGRKIEPSSTAFVVLLPYAAAQSWAVLTLHLGVRNCNVEEQETASQFRQVSSEIMCFSGRPVSYQGAPMAPIEGLPNEIAVVPPDSLSRRKAAAPQAENAPASTAGECSVHGNQKASRLPFDVGLVRNTGIDELIRIRVEMGLRFPVGGKLKRFQKAN